MSTTTAKVEAGTPTGPEFVDAKGLRVMFSIPTTTAYRLMKTGRIKGVSLREVGQVRGKRLWDVASVRSYLNSLTQP